MDGDKQKQGVFFSFLFLISVDRTCSWLKYTWLFSNLTPRCIRFQDSNKKIVGMGDPAFHRDCPLDCKVYVGNLGNNGNKTELERAFGYYGPLRSVWVARNPPGFAFVEFEDPRDASDAVRELDGRNMCGCRVRVELSTGEKRSRSRGPPPSWSRRPRDDFRRRSPPVRRRYVFLT
uniref:Serine/arginine-rich splicing factor 3 n=1 Tax=Acanthochromis polyacanthus TaxID=80966 RepID=A0A3Q1FDS0_9TELE